MLKTSRRDLWITWKGRSDLDFLRVVQSLSLRGLWGSVCNQLLQRYGRRGNGVPQLIVVLPCLHNFLLCLEWHLADVLICSLGFVLCSLQQLVSGTSWVLQRFQMEWTKCGSGSPFSGRTSLKKLLILSELGFFLKNENKYKCYCLHRRWENFVNKSAVFVLMLESLFSSVFPHQTFFPNSILQD